MAEMKNYLTEAFKALDEDVFDISTVDGIQKAEDFYEAPVEETEVIIDPLAETEEEVQDSYIGKVILKCNICQEKIYKDPSEIVFEEGEDSVNLEDVCPICQSEDGFKIVGQVAEFCKDCDEEEKVEPEVKVTVDDEEVDVKPEEENKVEEACTKRHLRKTKPVTEDLDKVEIEANGQKIKVETEPLQDKEESVEEEKEEVVAPVSDEVIKEFKDKNSDKFTEVDIDEIDEEGFNELGESYLKQVYSNVKSFKVTEGRQRGNSFVLEGLITFKSGKQVKTGFKFEAYKATKRGKLKFLGENKQFAKNKRSFILTTGLKEGKLITESLTYNYLVKDSNGKSKKVYGTVKNK